MRRRLSHHQRKYGTMEGPGASSTSQAEKTLPPTTLSLTFKQFVACILEHSAETESSARTTGEKGMSKPFKFRSSTGSSIVHKSDQRGYNDIDVLQLPASDHSQWLSLIECKDIALSDFMHFIDQFPIVSFGGVRLASARRSTQRSLPMDVDDSICFGQLHLVLRKPSLADTAIPTTSLHVDSTALCSATSYRFFMMTTKEMDPTQPSSGGFFGQRLSSSSPPQLQAASTLATSQSVQFLCAFLRMVAIRSEAWLHLHHRPPSLSIPTSFHNPFAVSPPAINLSLYGNNHENDLLIQQLTQDCVVPDHMFNVKIRAEGKNFNPASSIALSKAPVLCLDGCTFQDDGMALSDYIYDHGSMWSHISIHRTSMLLDYLGTAIMDSNRLVSIDLDLSYSISSFLQNIMSCKTLQSVKLHLMHTDPQSAMDGLIDLLRTSKFRSLTYNVADAWKSGCSSTSTAHHEAFGQRIITALRRNEHLLHLSSRPYLNSSDGAPATEQVRAMLKQNKLAELVHNTARHINASQDVGILGMAMCHGSIRTNAWLLHHLVKGSIDQIVALWGKESTNS